MRDSTGGAVSMMLAVLALPMSAIAQHRSTFISFDYPGAASTTPNGINADGAVVGYYKESSGKTRGFVLQAGTFTPIDYPGALMTMPEGINDQGDIVGTQTQNPGQPGLGLHGFLLRQGTFTDINYPDHMNTVPTRINNNGQIVGCYHDADLGPSMHAMMYSNGTFTALSIGSTMNMGVAPDGIAVGSYGITITAQSMRGYIANGDTPIYFDFPFAISTAATDINGSGEIVGLYVDSAKKTHGFLLRLGDAINTFGVNPQIGMTGAFEFTTIDYPGATSTEAWGINSRGDIVGDYTDAAGKAHGYIVNPAARRGQ